MATDGKLLRLAPTDNVVVVRQALLAGDAVEVEGVTVVIPERLGLGHKLACTPVTKGEKIVKYGAPIGRATEDIPVGTHVHIHNLVSDYTPTYSLPATEAEEL